MKITLNRKLEYTKIGVTLLPNHQYPAEHVVEFDRFNVILPNGGKIAVQWKFVKDIVS